MSKITLVQVGKNDLSEKYSMPDNVQWLVIEPENLSERIAQLNAEEKKQHRRLQFNMAFITDMDETTDLMTLDNFVVAYTVFYTDGIDAQTESQSYFFKKKRLKLF
ncbi:accessory Sec system protein Asp2 [Ligilactobacillus salivarius]|uniref:accessory Sec system protein Asp2 n=1 Tax=Ligilactobacillus salivarius TaxID=1624 RepID=UPI000668AB85|nr:accessory Sec system protein Asp2 [Ligilactobacillus salivarius]MDU7057649.1 accessory Sec system protein Asp2 [Ligilactobacillus salivarius]